MTTSRLGRSRVRGSRVYLREPMPRDCAEFLARNKASARLYRGLAKPMPDPAAFAAYLARCRQADFVGLVVCRVEDEAIVGSVNLSQIARGGFQSAYMGYQVFAPFDGQRYMTDAMPLVLRMVFGQLRLHRVEANIQPGNAASIALVRRAGFEKEGYSPRYLKIAGRWRDHERWAITAETYRKLEVRTQKSELERRTQN